MKRLTATVAATVAVAALAACAGPGPVDPTTALVVVGGTRSNSAAGDWPAVLDPFLAQDRPAGRSWAFVTADGRPSVAVTVPLGGVALNDLTASAEQAAQRDQLERHLSGLRADDPESDVLGALDLAARLLAGSPGPRRVVVLDSLLQTTGALRFPDHGGALLDADPAAVADDLAAGAALPDLTGVEVVLVGAGDTIAPQDALPPPVRGALVRLWTAVLERAGATVTVDPVPPPSHTGPPLPAVTPVPVAAPVPVRGTAQGPVPLRDGTVGFVPDRAEFRDPDQAAAVLAPFAERLLADGGRALLTGTTSSAGTPDGRRALSVDRASAVAGLLAAAGVPGDRIEVRGLGADFPGFVPDRDATGRLDPVLAALNRQVIVELVAGGR